MFSTLIPDRAAGMYDTHRAVRDNMDPTMPRDSELLKNLYGTFPFCLASHKRLLIHNQFEQPMYLTCWTKRTICLLV